MEFTQIPLISSIEIRTFKTGVKTPEAVLHNKQANTQTVGQGIRPSDARPKYLTKKSSDVRYRV